MICIWCTSQTEPLCKWWGWSYFLVFPAASSTRLNGFFHTIVPQTSQSWYVPNGHHCPPPCSQTCFSSWVPQLSESLPHPSSCPSQEPGLHASLLPLLHPAQGASLSAGRVDSISYNPLHLSSPPAPLLIDEFRALSLTGTAVIALKCSNVTLSSKLLPEKKLSKVQN